MATDAATGRARTGESVRETAANGVLSLLIWCGYPLVSIIGIAVTL